MQNRILYNKKNGTPIQIIAKAQTKPVLQDVICYQELEPPYDYFVMEKNQFFEEYVRSFQGLPRNDKKQLEVKEDLPGPVGEEKEETVFEYTFAFDNKLIRSREKLISSLIRLRYSVDDEIALSRQRDTKQEEWNTYNLFAEEAKSFANKVFETHNS